MDKPRFGRANRGSAMAGTNRLPFDRRDRRTVPVANQRWHTALKLNPRGALWLIEVIW
jgi:hypothetical protein